MDQLPSPNELKYKILIKTSVSKTTPAQLVEITHLEGGERKEEGEDGKKLRAKEREREKREREKMEEDDALESALRGMKGERGEREGRESGVGGGGSGSGGKKFYVNNISSVSESTLASHYRDSLESLVELNKTHLTRVYPMVCSFTFISNLLISFSFHY